VVLVLAVGARHTSACRCCRAGRSAAPTWSCHSSSPSWPAVRKVGSRWWGSQARSCTACGGIGSSNSMSACSVVIGSSNSMSACSVVIGSSRGGSGSRGGSARAHRRRHRHHRRQHRRRRQLQHQQRLQIRGSSAAPGWSCPAPPAPRPPGPTGSRCARHPPPRTPARCRPPQRPAGSRPLQGRGWGSQGGGGGVRHGAGR